MRRALFAGVMIALALAALPAQAALRLCNRTSYVLYAATSSVAGASRVTQGWTRIVPGDCKDAVAGALTASAYYVYARSSLAHGGAARAWGGNTPLCVRSGNFSSRVPASSFTCAADAYELPFAKVATRGMVSWTMNFDETPPLPSLTAAQLAGVKRLLRDNGYKAGAPGAASDAAPDAATGAALGAFRKTMRFAPDAGNDALFDALEAQALKSASPAGYTVCNDGTAAIAVALGIQQGKDWVSRGWWSVAAGGCARLLNVLAADRLYLLAQRPGGAPLVSGPEKFCIADIEFEVRGRANCAARGLGEAGFAATITHGRAGYVAHIAASGLLPAHEAMSK